MTFQSVPFALRLEPNSSVPKYIQAAKSIADDIKSGKIKKGQRIPSINDLSDRNGMSRDTIEKAYKILRDKELIFSVKGVGNFVSASTEDTKIKILFFINKPSSYKIETYDSFVKAMGTKVHVNMFLYYYDEALFISELKKNIDNYNYFIIMPHFRNKMQHHVNFTPKSLKAVESIPKDKLIILDNSPFEIKGNFASVYQDFQNDIASALENAVHKLKKYHKIILVYPVRSLYPCPAPVLSGFTSFCEKHKFSYEILDTVPDTLQFEVKQTYITVEDSDLVSLISQVKEKKGVLGKDVGVISYNETPLKALLDITVISTDFHAMGESAARLLLNGEKKAEKNLFLYIERGSI